MTLDELYTLCEERLTESTEIALYFSHAPAPTAARPDPFLVWQIDAIKADDGQYCGEEYVRAFCATLSLSLYDGHPDDVPQMMRTLWDVFAAAFFDDFGYLVRDFALTAPTENRLLRKMVATASGTLQGVIV